VLESSTLLAVMVDFQIAGITKDQPIF